MNLIYRVILITGALYLLLLLLFAASPDYGTVCDAYGCRAATIEDYQIERGR